MQERRTVKFSTLGSIRSKLFLLRIGVGVAMAFSLGIFCYYLMTHSMDKIRTENLERDTQVIIDLVSRKVVDYKKTLAEISTAEAVKKYFQNYSLNMIQGYMKNLHSPFDSLGLVDEEGMMDINLVRGTTALGSTNLKNDPDYLLAVQSKPGQTVMSQPRFVDYLGEYALVFDCMATDFFDKRLSFVRAAFPLARFAEIFAHAKIQTLNNIFIVSPSGQVIYSSLNSEDLGQDITKVRGLLGKLWADGRSIGEQTFADDSFKFKRDVVPELGWQVLVTADLALWEKPIAKLRNQIILFALLMVAVGEVISRLIGLKITEPITRLNRLAQTIVHSGRLSDRVEWQSMDELGELAQSVNLMLDRVEESHNQLLAEKQFVDNVLSSVVDGMAVCGADGMIIRINQALAHMLDYEQVEMLGVPVVSILPKEAVAFQDDGSVQLALDFEHQFLRVDNTLAPMKGGAELAVSCTISSIRDLSEQPAGFLVILTDIHERKQLEQAREKAESRLRETQDELLKTEKMAVVGQMSGMVAHEVLNPISAVKVRIDLGLPKAQELAKVIEVMGRIINDWRAEENKGTFADYFAVAGKKDLIILAKISDTLVKRNADRIVDLEFLDRQILRVIKIIDNLREMSRQEKTIEKVKVTQLLDEVIDDLGDGMRKRQIELRRDYRAEPTVMVDYMEAYSIFSNLIKNGMQAIDKQPQGHDRVISVVVDVANEEQAMMEISDTGIGMDATQCEAIFTPGFTSKGRQGTGIGTSFARKLARQFGGDIVLKESVPGKGTTFQVLLSMGVRYDQ
ncbi:MAG: PAS domain S-box protein [Desulfobulbaceae bacterium]|nr:PAS domain S-box protein [Desulfobulbaceae bacterium]